MAYNRRLHSSRAYGFQLTWLTSGMGAWSTENQLMWDSSAGRTGRVHSSSHVIIQQANLGILLNTRQSRQVRAPFQPLLRHLPSLRMTNWSWFGWSTPYPTKSPLKSRQTRTFGYPLDKASNMARPRVRVEGSYKVTWQEQE